MKKLFFILFLAILLHTGIILFTYNYPNLPIVYHYTMDLNLWLDMFRNIANGKIPMVDFGIEYPAGTVVLYWLIYLFYTSQTQFLIFHSMFMLGVFIVSFVYLYKIVKLLNIPHQMWVLALYSLSPTVLVLNHVRFDIVPLAFTLAGFYYYKKGRLYLPCILLGIGTSIKWFPAFMVIALAWEEFFINKKFFKALKLGIISFLSYVLLDLVFIIISFIKHGNITNWLFSFSANAGLTIYTDTIPGLIKIYYGKILPTYLPLYIFGSLFLIITIIPYPKDSLPRYILYCLSFLVFNKIYSPQFHMWFLPFLLLYIGKTRYYKLGFITIIFLELINISIYPFSFSWILEKLRFFELGPLFPIPSFKIFTWGIILRAIIVVSLLLYIYTKKRLPLYLSIMSIVIPLATMFYPVKLENVIHKKMVYLCSPLPKGSRISTDNTLYPYIKIRFPTTILTLDSEPDYILLNISPNIPYTRRIQYKRMLIDLLANKGYGVKKFIHEYILLEKGGSARYNDLIAKNIFGRFEAEYMPGAIGIRIKDLQAENRFARIAFKNTKTGYLIYGPYIPMLPGKYEVSFRLKRTDNTIDQIISKIDVAGKIGQKIYTQKDIYARDFKSANRYQSFKLDFTLSEFDKIEFRVYFTGKGDLVVDRIKVYSESHLMSTA